MARKKDPSIQSNLLVEIEVEKNLLALFIEPPRTFGMMFLCDILLHDVNMMRADFWAFNFILGWPLGLMVVHMGQNETKPTDFCDGRSQKQRGRCSPPSLQIQIQTQDRRCFSYFILIKEFSQIMYRCPVELSAHITYFLVRLMRLSVGENLLKERIWLQEKLPDVPVPLTPPRENEYDLFDLTTQVHKQSLIFKELAKELEYPMMCFIDY